MKFGLNIDDAALRAAFARLLARGGNLTPVMRAVAATVEQATQLRFRDGRSPEGPPWRPLAPTTRAARARRSSSRGKAAVRAALDGPMQPLRDTGRLANSITSAYGARQAVVGTNVTYAQIHQFGGLAGRGRKVRIPARPYLGLSPRDRAEILDILREHIDNPRR